MTAAGTGSPAPLRYGDHALQNADVYAAGGDAPVLVNIHGGAWFTGDKSLAEAWSAQMLARGVTVVNANYRMPAVDPVPTMVADAILALAAAAALFPRQRLLLCGDSAGAHIALLAATALCDPKDAGDVVSGVLDIDSCRELARRLDGVVLYCGALSLAALDVPAEHAHAERFAGYRTTIAGGRSGALLLAHLSVIDPVPRNASTMPPVLAFTSAIDFFHDSTLRWVAQARSAGIAVTLHDFDATHPLAKHSWQLEPARFPAERVYELTAAFARAPR